MTNKTSISSKISKNNGITKKSFNSKDKLNKFYERVVPDSLVLIEGVLYEAAKSGKIGDIIIPTSLITYLKYQASMQKAVGMIALEALDELTELKNEMNSFNITFMGKNTESMKDISFNMDKVTLDDIDSISRTFAYQENASFFTGNKSEYKIAKAMGIDVVFFEMDDKIKDIILAKFFDERTMSVHLRENMPPIAKKGRPGEWEFVEIRDEKLDVEELRNISREIIDEAKHLKDAFIEIERPGSTIIQLQNYRIVITRPPFSDGWEITAVRPVKKMELLDYELSEKLLDRISKQAEGILIAGSPGMGKSTFAAALAVFYASNKKIVKTVEAPRDLVLPDSVTQYAISHADPEEIHDILLLSRPDYTFFDEMRNTGDFKLFADLRLSGIGFIGIVHATKAIDAIQRFIGRIELGVIPQIIDTVIFIKDGTVNKVLSLMIQVKVPAGMQEADLARPVITISDYETGKSEFEIYTYGEATVVVPVSASVLDGKKKSVHALAERQVEKFFKNFSSIVKAEMVSDGRVKVFVPEQNIAKIIGKQGKTIMELEKELGLKIDVEEFEKRGKDNSDENKNNNKSGKKDKKKGNDEGSYEDYKKRNRDSEDSQYDEDNEEGYENDDLDEERERRTKGASANGSLIEYYDHKISSKSVSIVLPDEYKDTVVDVMIDGDYLLTARVSKKSMVKVKRNNKIGKMIYDAINKGGDGLKLFLRGDD